MVTQHKSLKQIVKERQLFTRDEIDATEEPAGWIQSGEIAYVFAASVYFCGVLARRALELTESTDDSGRHSPNGIESADTAIDLAGDVPHFIYRYGPDFPDGDQAAIEAVRQEANRKLAAKSVRSFEEQSSAREQWLSEVLSGAAPVFGRAAVKLYWSADYRRDVFKRFLIQAAQAGHVTLPVIRRFFAPPRANELDNALFPAGSPDFAEALPGQGSPATRSSELISPNPNLPTSSALPESASAPDESNEQSEGVKGERPPESPVQTTGAVAQRTTQPTPRKTRGRPVEIPDELKERALQAKGGKERAKILYQTNYPSVQQVKNVSTILRHYKRKRKSKSE